MVSSTKEYRYKISDLLKALDEAGIKKSQAWVYRQEIKGNLVLPKSTTDIKKPKWASKVGPVRIFTETQISQIVQAFLPGGVGNWSYR